MPVTIYLIIKYNQSVKLVLKDNGIVCKTIAIAAKEKTFE